VTFDLPPGPFPGVRVSRTATDTHVLRRAHDAGLLVRVRQGAYVDAAVWRAADKVGRSLLRVQAVAASRGFRDILSHESAAVLLGLPLLSEPTAVHVTAPAARSTRSRSGLVWHAGALVGDEVIDMPPFRLTGAVRTTADLARDSSFAEGVAAVDAALRLDFVTRQAVESALKASHRAVGRKAALRCVAFGDAASANAGESLSRVVVDGLGFARPVLQEPFEDDLGRIGFVDFWWKEAGIIGEFDGFQKYSKPEYLRGRSPSQVVVDEKQRERRLEARPCVAAVLRWVWADIVDPPRLHRILSRGGVPRK
jgi:hypothetical protein